MATANRLQRIVALRKAGWSESLIPTAVAVSLTEFGPQRDLITQAQSDVISNGVREESYGPFQILLSAHPDVSKQCASDLDCSAIAALRIYEGRGNFSAWSVFNSGAYLQNLDASQDGPVIGTVPTVPIGPPPQPPYNPLPTNPAPVVSPFPSFSFPHFDLIKPSSLKFPGGSFDFAGVGFDTGIVFKLGATVAIFVLIFIGVIKLTGMSQEARVVAP